MSMNGGLRDTREKVGGAVAKGNRKQGEEVQSVGSEPIAL